MKKSERVGALVKNIAASSYGVAGDPHYVGFFECFNRCEYYEAHDILEQLWLRCADSNRPFFQGLIQIAGAFVHLQKNFRRPSHPKDATRMRPAVRLFHLGVKNIAPFAPRHLRLDVAALCTMCEGITSEIVASHFQKNPWSPERAPLLRLA
jgi:Domain of unknown function (DUF309)